MISSHIVLGSGFGDEGKGLAVDFLSRQFTNPLVIRFNGGHQAGHTVATPEGQRHVFSNFGAGTLAGAPTYWSNYCTFSPVAVLSEYNSLKTSDVKNIKLYVDNLCHVVTPYDVWANRQHEDSDDKHGSCGVGFGTTIARNTLTPYRLYARDLLFPYVVKEKLKQIRNYYFKGLDTMPFNADFEDTKFLETVLPNLRKLVDEKVITMIAEEKLFQHYFFESYIFEGAQGILLDMDHGFFPHVTRSNTTSKNALKIIRRNKLDIDVTPEIYYMTRCYQTRHGLGPMSNEGTEVNLKNNELETNITNKYQGEFKKGILDLDLLQYALKTDENYSYGLNKRLFITCLDQIENVDKIPHTENGKIKHISYKNLHQFSNIKIVGLKDSFYSFGDKSSDIRTKP